MVKFYRGVAGKRPGAAKGWVFHNDAGSKNATAAFYRGWLPNHQAESGFAHDYIGIDGVYNAESYDNMAWHTANAEGNTWYLGVEKCQSQGDEKTFLLIEQKTYDHVAKWYKEKGITPNRNNVRLHHEFVSTSCPHRSMALHGKVTNAVKDYIIAELIKRLGKATTPSVPTVKPNTANIKVGDTVKVVDSLYRDSYGSGRSTAKRGQSGKVKSTSGPGGKKYLIENWGWAHANDIQLVTSAPAQTDWSKQYYTTNPGKVKLLKADGLYGANDVDFKGGKVGGDYPVGTVFVITGVKKRSDGLPRLVTQSGYLLSANRSIVQQVTTVAKGYPLRKVGDTVTVKKTATSYQTGQKIASFVKGSKYKIKQVKNVSQSNSKRAYLLDNINSWVLEQDVQ